MPASDVSLFDWLWPRPHRVFSGHWKEYHHSNITTQQARVPCDCISQPFTHKHTETTHSLSPCPSTTSNWDNWEISAKVSLRSLVKQEGHTKIRHHMLILAKPYKVKVWHSDGSYAGWGSYAGTLKTSRGDATLEKVMRKGVDVASQSHPLSFIMWDSSMMNFPSLYFWLSSNACSCREEVR